jgi:hypothetical protein
MVSKEIGNFWLRFSCSVSYSLTSHYTVLMVTNTFLFMSYAIGVSRISSAWLVFLSILFSASPGSFFLLFSASPCAFFSHVSIKKWSFLACLQELSIGVNILEPMVIGAPFWYTWCACQMLLSPRLSNASNQTRITGPSAIWHTPR